MFVRFENSHQRVGLNRVGKYYKTVPEKGPDSSAGLRAPPTNEPWRRWTGIVGADERRQTWKQRKRGIRRLLRQIENRVCHIGPPLGATRLAVETGAFAERTRKRSKALDICPSELGHWARSQTAGRTLESICAEFGVSSAKLSSLTREYNGMNAQDVIDGYNVRGLRKFLIAQLREAAFCLWGPPGEFAERRCMVAPQRDTTLRSVSRHPRKGDIANRALGLSSSSAPKRSKYFRTQPWEFFGVLPGDEERMRVSELLGKLDALRAEHDWRVDNLAIQLGFENAGKLKRACLNVMGRTLEQIERIMAREIVDYYLAAEDRELRRIAVMHVCHGQPAVGCPCEGGENVGTSDDHGEVARATANGRRCPWHTTPALDPHLIYAAREIYCGDAETIPEEPFLDRWSAYEFAKPQWLAEMRKEFG